MRFGLIAPNAGPYAKPLNVLTLAEAAEEAGWEALFLWDHLAWVWGPASADPWTMLGAVAVRSERLLLGTAVTPVPRRRPQVLAAQVATLDDISGGRAVLGAGLGGNRREFEEFGEDFDERRRAALLDEGLALMRSLWAGPLGPREIPIWIGGASDAALRRALRYDGWITDELDPKRMTTTAEQLSARLEAARPRDVAVLGYSGAGVRGVHAAYAAAGATWWLENLHERRAPFEEMLARVRAGP